MKYRSDFVTNSSSSSYICDICGNVEGGYEASLSDFDMSRCENGHTWCNSHHKIETTDDEEVDIYNIPADKCPICTFKELSQDDGYKFLKVHFNLSDEKILKMMKETSENDYKVLSKFLKGK